MCPSSAGRVPTAGTAIDIDRPRTKFSRDLANHPVPDAEEWDLVHAAQRNADGEPDFIHVDLWGKSSQDDGEIDTATGRRGRNVPDRPSRHFVECR